MTSPVVQSCCSLKVLAMAMTHMCQCETVGRARVMHHVINLSKYVSVDPTPYYFVVAIGSWVTYHGQAQTERCCLLESW